MIYGCQQIRPGRAARGTGRWLRSTPERALNRSPLVETQVGKRIAPDAAVRASWGELSQQRPRTIALVAWRPHVKGALRGFVTVTLPAGLRLIDCPVLVSDRKAWVNLPAKPVLDRDGRQKTDANGKLVYAPILEWGSRELSDRFSEVVIEAIRQKYPSALSEAGT